MTSMPYVLIVLFMFNDGSALVMNTSEGFASPMSCSMQAFIENESVHDRTYICVTRERAVALAGATVEVGTPARDATEQQGALTR